MLIVFLDMCQQPCGWMLSLEMHLGLRIRMWHPSSELGQRSDECKMKIYRSAQEKSSFFAFTPRTKILKRELSRRKLREISRKFVQTFFFLAEKLHKNLRKNSVNFRRETLRTFTEFLHKISRRYSAETLGVI